MKCYKCCGTGYYDIDTECPVCDGTGEYEPFDADIELDKLDNEPQTNEEWLKSLDTEELAKVLFCFFGDGVTFCERNYSNTHLFFTDDDYVSDDSVYKWLKEVHKE